MLAVAFNERHSESVAALIASYSELISSNLLEAEARAGFARERRPFLPSVLRGIGWIFPNRPLGSEFERVLNAGYLRGADLWHVAVALYTASEPGELAFVTLDRRQQAVAASLGFQT